MSDPVSSDPLSPAGPAAPVDLPDVVPPDPPAVRRSILEVAQETTDYQRAQAVIHRNNRQSAVIEHARAALKERFSFDTRADEWRPNSAPVTDTEAACVLWMDPQDQITFAYVERPQSIGRLYWVRPDGVRVDVPDSTTAPSWLIDVVQQWQSTQP